MGFFSDLMKNPLVKMLAPMAMAWAAPYAFGATGMSGIFSGMNPMAANALKQSMLGYGTGMLTGAEDPGKTAMYSGIASLPFSYMSAAQSAADWNQNIAGRAGKVPVYTKGITGVENVQAAGMPPMHRSIVGKPVLSHYAEGMTPEKISAWDILKAPSSGLPVQYPSYEHPSRMINTAGGKQLPDLVPGREGTLTADIFTKTSPGGVGYGGKEIPPGTVSPDWIPTMAIQGLGATGEYIETQDERARKAWLKNKEKRRKELAWMYGVPEDMIEGEMDNPWYRPGGYWNKGGIASLENGGGVNGPGTGTSDSIDAKLSDGEFVMTAKAVENLGGGDRYEGARKMYGMMNMLDPESETMSEVV